MSWLKNIDGGTYEGHDNVTDEYIEQMSKNQRAFWAGIKFATEHLDQVMQPDGNWKSIPPCYHDFNFGYEHFLVDEKNKKENK